MPATGPGLRAHRPARGRQDRRSVLPAEREGPAVDRERGWEYRTTLAVDAATLARERVELVFAGLDTYAEVFVNGVSVLTADNMFRTLARRREGAAQAGDNVIVVRFARRSRRSSRPTTRSATSCRPRTTRRKEMVSMLTRKAPYHYGWDWGPRFVTSGIWRPVTLEAWDVARLDDVQIFQTQLDAGAAELGVVARVVAARAGRARVDGRRRRRAGRWAQPTSTLAAGANESGWARASTSPSCGGRTGLGAQQLYTLETTLTVDGAPRARAPHAHRPADAGGRARARQARARASHQGQRRARVHEGRQLDPGRQLRHARDRGAIPLPAAVGRRRQHEHAARVGRRHLRGRPLLRPRRRAGAAGLAGLHVRLQHVPRRRRRSSRTSARRRSRTCAACATTRAWRCGRATTRTKRPGSNGAGR